MELFRPSLASMGKIENQRRKMTDIGYINNTMANGSVANGNPEKKG